MKREEAKGRRGKGAELLLFKLGTLPLPLCSFRSVVLVASPSPSSLVVACRSLQPTASHHYNHTYNHRLQLLLVLSLSPSHHASNRALCRRRCTCCSRPRRTGCMYTIYPIHSPLFCIHPTLLGHFTHCLDHLLWWPALLCTMAGMA